MGYLFVLNIFYYMNELLLFYQRKIRVLCSVLVCSLVLSSCLWNKNKNTESGNNDFPKSGISEIDTLLTYPASEGKFYIKFAENKLFIIPDGMSECNDTIVHEIEKSYLYDTSMIGDLNSDGFPEIITIFKSPDKSGNRILCYSSNNGKSISQVYVQDIADNDKINEGYIGYAEMEIVENCFCIRFPLFDFSGNGYERRGKIRQVQYVLKDGEACPYLYVDKFYEYDDPSK